MTFWCHRLDQNSNENIVRISALKCFIASLGLPGDLVSNIINKEAYEKPQKASRKPQKISGQKSLQYFCCYFGRNDDTKKTFRNKLTFSFIRQIQFKIPLCVFFEM